MTDGIINIDTEPARLLEFTSDKFNPASYLWKTGDTVIISFIMARQKGAFRQLIENITAQGFYFEIPTPSGRMREIGRKQGWRYCQREHEELGPIDILTNKTNLGNNGKNETTMLNANRNKIIHFPGVLLKQGDSIQNTLDDTEAPKVRGLPQSESLQNEVESFLREMGYVE
jgi:hypothetical protein